MNGIRHMADERKPCEGPPLSYLAWHADAARRHARGERQVYCGLCGRWVWPAHIAPAHAGHAMTARQFREAARLAKRLADEGKAAG